MKAPFAAREQDRESKKILIINGHPDRESFCAALAMRYKQGVESTTATCQTINLIDLKFDPILRYGYRQRTELEPDLLDAQRKILEADHIVILYPVWWGTYPALFKGFIDRVFLPGFAFKYHSGSLFWDKRLRNKTARVIITMDTPIWYDFLVYGMPGIRALKKCILNFCGIKPVRTTIFSPIKLSDANQRMEWMKRVEALGRKLS